MYFLHKVMACRLVPGRPVLLYAEYIYYNTIYEYILA